MLRKPDRRQTSRPHGEAVLDPTQSPRSGAGITLHLGRGDRFVFASSASAPAARPDRANARIAGPPRRLLIYPSTAYRGEARPCAGLLSACPGPAPPAPVLKWRAH